MTMDSARDREILEGIAERVMKERGLLSEFSPQVQEELDSIHESAAAAHDRTSADLTNLLWASIDNDDSHDLDQLTAAEALPGDVVKIRVAIADVDSIVKNGSAIDAHARHNTTSVYTAACIFPMLPEKLSTDLTSLNPDVDRAAIVVEFTIGADGALHDSNLYRARVHNHAKLAYNSVGAWLEGAGSMPAPIEAVSALATNLQLQDKVAQRMRTFRRINGALSLETIEARPIFDGDQICDLEVQLRNRATDIIEDFMIASNGVTARYLSSHRFPSVRRVVRTPKRWDRIVELAREHNFKLPDVPDSKALDEFLLMEKTADPLRFPDLSLAVIKLLGSGEYVAELPDETAPGHFGLAVKDYAHSTAPNRRYPDLITQRLLKAALAGNSPPYSGEELDALAKHCTELEDAANKVERQVGKSAAALLLKSRIGERFDAVVSGAADKGTWVRLLTMPVEGKLVAGYQNMDVGDRLRVQLLSVNVDLGFIDFKKVH
jgi:VacB/RNase II family 3'-5' exoribonuclease